MNEWNQPKSPSFGSIPKVSAQGFKPGELLLNKFEIIRPLRSGGNGEVYLVTHLDFPDRQIALKVLTFTANEDRQVSIARFRNEVRAAYSVTHPNVVRVFDYIHEGDFVAFTMEYVLGGDLADLLSGNRRLSLQQIMHVLLQICEGIQAIHDAQIIHKDIKPENILITKDGQVKITDFGTARLGSTLSKRGGITGTIAYLSPEYLKDGHLDQRSDIYAMGIMAYEMVAGRQPFKGESLMATMSARMHETPVPPHQFNPVCPPTLSNIILKCLRHSPAERYQRVFDLLRDLKKVPLAKNSARRSSVGSSGVHPVAFGMPSDEQKVKVKVQPPSSSRSSGSLPTAPTSNGASSLRPQVSGSGSSLQSTSAQPSEVASSASGFAIPQHPEPKYTASSDSPLSVPRIAPQAPRRKRPSKSNTRSRAPLIILVGFGFLVGIVAATVATKLSSKKQEPVPIAQQIETPLALEELPSGSVEEQADYALLALAEAMRATSDDNQNAVKTPAAYADDQLAEATTSSLEPDTFEPERKEILEPSEAEVHVTPKLSNPPISARAYYIQFLETLDGDYGKAMRDELTAAGYDSELRVVETDIAVVYKVLLGPLATQEAAESILSQFAISGSEVERPILQLEQSH